MLASLSQSSHGYSIVGEGGELHMKEMTMDVQLIQFSNPLKNHEKWHKNRAKLEKYLKEERYRCHNIQTKDAGLQRGKNNKLALSNIILAE